MRIDALCPTLQHLAERVGFEPTAGRRTAAIKACYDYSRSRTSPLPNLIRSIPGAHP
jgi:hypothetical protein